MIVAFIRNNATSETRTVPFDTPWEDHSDYQWSEGNYACDCNRALFFAEADGEEDPDRECGDSAYSVAILDGDAPRYADDGVFCLSWTVLTPSPT